RIIERLRKKLHRWTAGLSWLGLTVLGGQTPIISVLVGDEEATIRAGHYLFEQGYYVQSVTFPAVPYHAGVLRVQVNSNHLPESIDGLLDALAALKRVIPLPGPDDPHRHAA